MSISSRSPRRRARRITISLPGALVEGLDEQVAAGAADTRTDLIAPAVENELRRLRNEAIDAEIYALADDPELAALERQITKEFESADAEAWAMLAEEFGPEAESPEE